MKDYATSGLDIQAAMVDQARLYPNKQERPPYLLWEGRKVLTSDLILTPKNGVVTARFVSGVDERRQGFDLKLSDGSFVLQGGEQIDHLRTWRDERFED